jgi:NitT/TauT family transport system substrate-binding protein
MTLQDITIVNMEVDSHEEAYARDLIDAMVTFEPVRTRLISEGGNEVFSSREIPGEIVDVLVVHEDILNNKQHTQVKDLINAWFRALDYLTNKKHSAAGILSARLKISAEEVIESFNGLDLPNRQDNLDLLGGDSPRLELVLKRLHNTLLQNELLIKPVSFNGLLYSDILQD